ncbi:restriction endonuclease subunit S [Halomonas sp. IOP_6]|uniref:restriction endonuclease subunit S n=1 Tax=Halomonas sp. IOP_6 TaxID=2876583 RepID=UPI001E58C75A|nr:restriction endonuclease subunit S [Halomonas sp. IOP_6]MCD6005750.1 restriction endonuclease subunit S [Halomonas sp. IOP_6]
MSYPAYPEYKDSGVEWLGEVPAHWDVFSIKRDLEFLTSGSRGWASHYSDDGAAFIRIGNLTRNHIYLDMTDLQRVNVPDGSEGERTKVQEGDVLFSITAYLGSVAVVPSVIETAYVSQHVALARLFKKRILPSWVAYVTLSDVGKNYLSSQGYGGTKIQLSLEDVADLLITVPPLDEQAKISTFLGHETARIDALVEQQQRLIKLLKEKRQAVIFHAVTKGLDPDAPMKDSGVEWLGEVPEHWVVTRAKMISDIFIPQRNKPELNDSGDGCFWVTMEEMKFEKITGAQRCVSATEITKAGSRVLKAGAVVASCVGNFGIASLLLVDAVINQQLQAYIPRGISAAYLRDVIICSKPYFDLVGKSATLVYVNQEGFANLPVPLPSKDEQREIETYITKRKINFDIAISRAFKLTSLLQERRSALISAAVTGKIDVRGWQPPLELSESRETADEV